ncbi:MAG: hypothetical protein QOD64_466, partial [Verrucomicrobiota bacterium]
MRRLGYRVVDILVEHFAAMRDGPVGARKQPGEFLDIFQQSAPEAPTDPQELLARLEK